jgi:hypothetical protein
MRKRDAVADGCGDQTFPIDNPSQDRFFIFYVVELDQNIQEFFQSLDLIGRFEIKDNLIESQIFAKTCVLGSTYILHWKLF